MQTINENKNSINAELINLKEKIRNIENISESSKQRIIEVERTLASELSPTIQPQKIDKQNAETDHIEQKESLRDTKAIIDLLVIGSSIVRYIDANKIERRNPKTSQTVCIPGGKTEDIIRVLREINDNYNIKKMIVHVGVNHIPDISPDQLIDRLIKMYFEIRNILPNTGVYHSGMIPRHDNQIVHAINIINKNIELHCRSLNIKTILHPQFGIHEMNFEIFKRDHIHHNVKGTSTLAMNMIAVYRNYNIQNKNYTNQRQSHAIE